LARSASSRFTAQTLQWRPNKKQPFSQSIGLILKWEVTTALLDRLTRRCHIVKTGNNSYRFKASSDVAKKTRKDTSAFTKS
jgi:hypothetical protein